MSVRFYYKNKEEIIPIMKDLFNINEITYYKELVNERFVNFLKLNNFLLTDIEKNILKKIFNNYNSIIDIAGRFPLNFCLGDLKSPNIFYKEEVNKNIKPMFLDWQYIHLNKGISDIAFLLVESTNYNEEHVDIIIKYYFKKSKMYENIQD